MKVTRVRRQFARLGRLVGLTRTERGDLVRAQWAIVAARVELGTRRTGTLVRHDAADLLSTAAADGRTASASAPVTAADAARARALDTAVRRAAAYGALGTTCLVRATALQRLLEREGIRDAHLRVGVRRTNGHFAAHAWLELGDMVLGDQPQHVRTFTPTSMRLVRR